MLRNLCLTLSRFTLAAWVGAACLFVITTLQDVHSPDLSSVEKAEIVVRRFPIYYRFGFGLLISALVLTITAELLSGGIRRWLTVSLALLPVLLITADYVWIYLPLETMTAAVDRARPAAFIEYHSASKWINAVQVSASLLAAIAVCRPASSPTRAPGHAE